MAPPRSIESGVVVARIGKPHGLRGEVTVQVHTDDPQSRFVPGVVFATAAQPGTGVPRHLTLSTARIHRTVWLLGFAEIPDRTGAESLRGTQLLLEVSEADHDDYYESDLVGLEATRPDGTRLGVITGLTARTHQDLLEVRLDDGTDVLVPFVAAIVTGVDIDAGRIIIDAPHGLFELGAKE